MWDLSYPTRDRTLVPCIGWWILNHWTTGKSLVSISDDNITHPLLPTGTVGNEDVWSFPDLCLWTVLGWRGITKLWFSVTLARASTKRLGMRWDTFVFKETQFHSLSHPTFLPNLCFLGDTHLFSPKNTADKRKFLLPPYLQLLLPQIHSLHLLLFPPVFFSLATRHSRLICFSRLRVEFDSVHGNSQAELTALSDSEHSSWHPCMGVSACARVRVHVCAHTHTHTSP